MNDNDAAELLAQAIWMQHFGIKTIRASWVSFAADNPTKADALRSQAAAMIATSRANNNQGLGWLFS